MHGSIVPQVTSQRHLEGIGGRGIYSQTGCAGPTARQQPSTCFSVKLLPPPHPPTPQPHTTPPSLPLSVLAPCLLTGGVLCSPNAGTGHLRRGALVNARRTPHRLPSDVVLDRKVGPSEPRQQQLPNGQSPTSEAEFRLRFGDVIAWVTCPTITES